MSTNQTASVVIILNACFMFLIVITALFFLGLLTDLGAGGEMRAVVIASIMLFSNVGFFAFGIGFLIAGKSSPVSWFNKLLPWLVIVSFSTAAIDGIYTPLTGPVTDAQVALIGVSVAIIALILILIETIKFSKRVKGADDEAVSSSGALQGK